MNRVVTTAILLGPLIILANCAGTRWMDIRPEELIGIPFNTFAKQYDLQNYEKASAMTNLPPDVGSMVTYFLPEGNLLIGSHPHTGRISTAQFIPSLRSAQERYDEDSRDYHKWIEAHTIPKRP